MPQLKTTNQEFSHWIIASPTPGTDRRRRSIDAQGDGMAVHATGKQGFKVQSNLVYLLRVAATTVILARTGACEHEETRRCC